MPAKFYEQKLLTASRDGQLFVVRHFVEDKKVNPNHQDEAGRTPLYFAAQSGCKDIVEYLIGLEGGKDNLLVKENSFGNTPLHAACRHLEVVKYFIEEELIPNPESCLNSYNNNVLHSAIIAGSEEVVKYLLEKGFDPKQPGQNGLNPLHMACGYTQAKDTSLAKLLIEKGVDCNEQDSDGNTPLHSAVCRRRLHMVEFLVDEIECDLTILNNEGKLPVVYAIETNDQHIIEVFLEKGAVDRPVIIDPPDDQTKQFGDKGTVFKVKANGTKLAYQWLKDDIIITSETHPYCSGMDTDELHIGTIVTSYEGGYKCIVSNPAGKVESKSAQLGVVSPMASLFTHDKTLKPADDLLPYGPPVVFEVDSGGVKKTDIAGIEIEIPPSETKEGSKVDVTVQLFKSSTAHIIVSPDQESGKELKICSPIYFLASSSELTNAKIAIEGFADLKSIDSSSDLVLLHSPDSEPQYHFSPIKSELKPNGMVEAMIISGSTSGRYAVGCSKERGELYKTHFLHPLPRLSKKCAYALFSVSPNHGAYEKQLMAEMQQRFNVEFSYTSHVVSIAKDVESIELTPLADLQEIGYKLSAENQEKLMILVDSVKTGSDDSILPQSLLLHIETTTDDLSQTLHDVKYHLKVTGTAESIPDLILDVEGFSPRTPEESVQGLTKLSEEDLEMIIFEILSPFAGKWRQIGVELGFTQQELAAFERDDELLEKFQGGPKGFFKQLLLDWEPKPNCTLEAMESALRSEDVGLTQVADYLRMIYLEAKALGAGHVLIWQKFLQQKESCTIAPPESPVTDLVYLSDKAPKETLSATRIWMIEDKVHYKLDGQGITIAILDTAINTDHEAFKAAIQEGRITVLEGMDEKLKKPGGHGTMAAFIAGGDSVEKVKYGGDDYIDIPSGVAPKASLIICPTGRSYELVTVSKILDKLLERKKRGKDLDIVSMSFGSEYKAINYKQEEVSQKIKELHDLGVICIASSGNYGNYRGGVLFPAILDEVISVGALTVKGHKRDSNASVGIDVYAPGEGIVVPSLDRKNPKSFCTTQGSSCACPAIAGLIALLLQYAKTSFESDSMEFKRYYKLPYLKARLFRQMMVRGNPELLEPYAFFKENCGQDI